MDIHDGIQLRASKKVSRGSATAACRHSCSEHAEVMDSSIWSHLPEELMELVFARLPWPALIYQVRTLSKGWNRKMNARDSLFLRTCGNAQPRMFGLLSQGDSNGSFRVNMFNIKANRWHTHETKDKIPHDPAHTLGYDSRYRNIQTVNASDGGLVCFAAKSKTNSSKSPLLLLVCNPLTQVWKRLPPLFGLIQQQFMFQLIMDRETKQYRVVVVAHSKEPKVGNEVHVYHSGTRPHHSGTWQWTRVDCHSFGEVVYGYLYDLSVSSDDLSVSSPYVFGDGKLLEVNTMNLKREAGADFVWHSFLVKDHFYVLNEKRGVCCTRFGHAGTLPRYWISEYGAQYSGGAASWTRLKEYNFNYTQIISRLNKLPSIHHSFYLQSQAYEDLVVVYVADGPRELLWLFNLSTAKWQELPTMPEDNDLFHEQDQMCELRCDVVP